MMKKTMSTQYDDKSLERLQIKQSVVGVIEEINSNEDHHTNRLNDAESVGGAATNKRNFPKLTLNNPDNVRFNNVNSNPAVVSNNPDSPSETVKKGQDQEQKRNQYHQDASQMIINYKSFDGCQLQIEGPYLMQDKSYSLVNSCIEIKKVEQGIPIDPFLLLKGPSQVTEDSLYKDSLVNF